MFSIIAAVGQNKALGKANALVFHIKEDMKFFRETTAGHKVVMGRTTWESLPGKLQNRKNLVVSRHPVHGADQTITNLPDFITEHKDTAEEIFIAGGGSIYRQFLPHAQVLYLTEINASPEADTFFPDFDASAFKKTIIKKGKADDLEYAFVKYTRK